jgi:hypothetical protein
MVILFVKDSFALLVSFSNEQPQQQQWSSSILQRSRWLKSPSTLRSTSSRNCQASNTIISSGWFIMSSIIKIFTWTGMFLCSFRKYNNIHLFQLGLQVNYAWKISIDFWIKNSSRLCSTTSLLVRKFFVLFSFNSDSSELSKVNSSSVFFTEKIFLF